MKLLVPVLGTITIATAMVPALTSCKNNGLQPGTAITPTIIASEHVKVTCSDVKAYEAFTITCEFDDGYEFSEATIKVGSTILAKNIDYTVNGNQITVDKDSVNNASIKILVTAKETEIIEELYVKENSYLCENLYIETEYNAVSHEIKFGLKKNLEAGQKLVAKITEIAEESDKIIKDQGEIDLTDYTFGNIVYVPVLYYLYKVRWTQITKLTVELSCISSTNETVWTDKYDTMYIKFNAVNAWPGYDFRGERNDYTRMDMAYYVVTLGGTGYQQTSFPFSVELREKVADSETLHAKVFNSVLRNRDGQLIEGVNVGMQNIGVEQEKGISSGNWIRQAEGTSPKMAWENIGQNISRDVTDVKYETTYDLFMTLQYNNESEGHKIGEPVSGVDDGGVFDHAFATFDLVLYKTNSNNEIVFAETFSGCGMQFIPGGFDK